MRDNDTRPFFKTLGDMFGFSNCFQRTHEMFNKTLLYLTEGSYLPTPKEHGLKEDLGYWYGHLGGIEGLRQKSWTL